MIENKYYARSNASFVPGNHSWIPSTPLITCVPLPHASPLKSRKSSSAQPSSSVCVDPYLTTVAVNISADPHPSGNLIDHNLMHFATIPPVKKITLISHDFQWRVDVHATSHHYVTIFDVFKSLHTAVYTSVTSREAKELTSLGMPILDNRDWRLRNPRSASDARHVGLCRIDSLNGKRVARFKDLRAHAGELNLNVEFSIF